VTTTLVRGTSLIAALAIALFGLTVFTAAGGAQASGINCSDFGSQASAQQWFNNHSPSADPEGLDSDGDGVACESNPCPCSTAGPGSGGDTNGTGTGGGGGGTKSVLRQHARIIKVTDGDTVKVRLSSGGQRNVRLIGIDTPEVYGGVECGGPEASRAAKQWLPKGTRVLLVSDSSQALKDRYGRLLRYVVKGKSDIGLRQLKKGNASVYVYNHHPFQRVAGYRAAQKAAKSGRLGMWGSC
jgi:endonuclease YncB( thermonuclease family)